MFTYIQIFMEQNIVAIITVCVALYKDHIYMNNKIE